MTEKTTCEQESLRTQLSELNTRSRAYTAQLWQVPFAYIGILGVVLAQVADKGAGTLAATLLCGGILGTAVIIHMTAMMEGVKRAVANIVKAKATSDSNRRPSIVLCGTSARSSAWSS